MKNTIKTIVKACAATMAASTMAFMAPTQAADIKLRAVTYMPATKFEDSMAVFKSWAQKVNEKTDGKVEINIIGGPEIFSVTDQVSAASKGLVDIVLTFTSHASVVPEVNTVGLSSVSVQEERENGYVDLLDKAHEKINLKFIGRASTNSGFFIFSRKPINELNDFKGLKIRSHAGYNSVFNAVGASPVGIGISEIYSALERSLVDAAPYNLFVHDMGIAEVTKYALSDSFWKSHTTMILMNRKKFDGLPADIQQAMIDAQIENEAEMAGLVAELQAEERKKLEAAGVTFTSLPADDATKWARISIDERFKDFEDKLPPEQMDRIKSMIVRH